MAFELPVAFDRCGARTSVGDAKVHVKPNSVHGYARVTVEVLDDPRRTRLGRPGRALVELELGWSHPKQAFLSVNRRLTDGTKTLERTLGGRCAGSRELPAEWPRDLEPWGQRGLGKSWLPAAPGHRCGRRYQSAAVRKQPDSRR